jgi:hypothetical protein
MSRIQQRTWFLTLLSGVGVPFLVHAADVQPTAAKSVVSEAKTAAPVEAKRDPPGGWRVVMKGETVYWCTRQIQTGSRIRSEERCMTPAQYDALVVASQEMVEDARRTMRGCPPTMTCSGGS